MKLYSIMWNQDLYQKTILFAAAAHKDQKVPGTNLTYLVHLSNVCMEILAALANSTDDVDGDLCMEGENFEISLFDTSGKLVVNRQEKVKQARINMDTQQLKGLFILKIVGNRGAAFTKIISK